MVLILLLVFLNLGIKIWVVDFSGVIKKFLVFSLEKKVLSSKQRVAHQVFDEMSHLERALEWLRPLVLNSNIWDYCVLWKLGDDPSRYPF